MQEKCKNNNKIFTRLLATVLELSPRREWPSYATIVVCPFYTWDADIGKWQRQYGVIWKAIIE